MDPEVFFSGGDVRATASDPARAEEQAPSTGVTTAAPEPDVVEQEQAPEVDYKAEAKRAREEADAARAAAAENEARMAQVRQGIEQMMRQQEDTRRKQEFQQRAKNLVNTANSMRAEEAATFLETNMLNLQAEWEQKAQQDWQQREQQYQQVFRQVASEPYKHKLAEDYGLNKENRQRLLDQNIAPELAEQIAPMLKQQQDDRKEWERRLEQASRTAKAGERANSDMVNTTGGGAMTTAGIEVPSHLHGEEKLMWIYDNIVHAQ